MTWWAWILIGIAIAIVLTAVILPLCKVHKEMLLNEADEFLINEFSRCNVMVFGKKRQGKDLIFAHVIALKGDKHYANIFYNENTEIRPLSDLNVGSNTSDDFINGTVKPFSPNFEEGCDFYVSDAGIYLPCHQNRELNVKYPGMPIFFALSGQLYDMRVHTNSQALGRPWDKIREQADSYIQILGTTVGENCLYTRIVAYDKYSDAERETNPIARYTVRIPKSELKYNSRWFRDFLFDSPPLMRKQILSLLR